MKAQEIFIVHPQTTEQISALKAFMLALKIKFEVTKTGYNHTFVEKILKSEEQINENKVTRVEKESLKEFLGL